MASENVKDSSLGSSVAEVEQMAKYGITRIPVYYFHYKQFRYTNLNDAVAQAKRDQEQQRID